MRCNEYKNIIFYIGSNAKENWELLDKSKQINDNFIWFHLNSFSSPYVIMYKTIDELNNIFNKSEIDDIYRFAANLCKQHSKYKFLNNLKIVYSPLKKLSKGDNIGEVIIRGKRNIISL